MRFVMSERFIVPRGRQFLAIGIVQFLMLCRLAGAVTFTITPAAVSNTYNGAITLQISGLTNNETVVIQKFLDLNTNGVIDAGDWLVQQFNLTDGQAGMVIGGVTNFNVPGDTDTTPGQITAQLNFRSGDFMQNIVGQYLFKISSPSGRFAPVTNLFSVTSVPYSQKFTGGVVINGTSTPVPNALVLLLEGGGKGNPQMGAVAGNSGSYTLPAPPGTYMLGAFKNNYVVNFSTLPALTLGSGQTLTTNLAVTNATASISGQLVDAANSTIGLPGILLSVQATNGLMGVGFTDTNGNFTVGVASNLGPWEIDVSDTHLMTHGYVGWNKETNVSAGATGVTLAYPKATALFYGSVRDNLGNPIPGMDVESYDNNNVYETDGYTDTNGNYAVVALGGLDYDPWYIQVSSDTGPANYLFSQPDFDQNGGTNLNAGQALLVNFTALLATNTISGVVQDNKGNPIGGVGVWANATLHGVYYRQYADTDGGGNYALNVTNGSWTVGVNCSGGSDSLASILSGDNYECPNNQSVGITNNNATANFTVTIFPTPLRVTTYNLPNATQGVSYNQQLQASGGQPPYSWSLARGSGSLPTGLSLSASGVISGAPAIHGTYYFYVQATDTTNATAEQALSLTIQSAAPITNGVTLSTWYEFSNSGTNGGSEPEGGLVQGSDGAFYGTAYSGGTNYDGTVFRISTNGVPIASMSLNYSNGTEPQGGLVEGRDGSLYGTTSYGGAHYSGTVFNLATNGVLTALYSFTGGNDGGTPQAGLVQAPDGNLYGTTYYDGTNYNGTVFRISTNGVFQSLYSFTGGNDGANPSAPLIEGGNGNLYGTTYYGGSNSSGTVFRISTNGAFRSLYSFTGGNDGGYPSAGLALGSNGILYGTTTQGGAGGNGFMFGGSGTVFGITTNGTLNTLYSFTGWNDGSEPRGGLTQGSDGNLYGTTAYGGMHGSGTVFDMTANGILATLYSFSGLGDGSQPGTLLQASDGAFYGTTSYGGTQSGGTVFRLSLNSVPSPDLAPFAVTGPATLITPQLNTAVQVAWSVTNQGAGQAPGGWCDRVWFSTNGVLDGNSVAAGDFYNSQTLPPGGSYRETNTAILPLPGIASGSYTLFVQANVYGQIYESNTSNNVAAAPSATFTLRPPDLAPVSWVVPATVVSSQGQPLVQVSWVVTNYGPGLAPGGWYDAVWFSTNGVLDINSQEIGDFYHSQNLPAGGSYSMTNSVNLPMTASGPYTLFVKVDAYDQVFEFNKSNNISAGAQGTFTFNSPDLAVLSVTPATNNVVFYPASPQSPTVQLAWAVTNQGVGPAVGDWYDRVYVSTNSTIAGAVSSQYFWQYWASPPFAAGAEYQVTNTISLPQQSGTYYLIVSVDDGGYITEANKSNNVLASPPLTLTYQISPCDLAVISASAPATVSSIKPNPEVQVTWAVTNQGAGAAPGGWYDRIWFSTNGVLDTNSQDLADVYHSQSLPAGGSYAQTDNVSLPMTASGSYTLFVQVDVYNSVPELNKANNISAALPGVFTLIQNGVSLSTWYSFTGGNDGGYPSAVLGQGNDGNFYGTTSSGGTNSEGTVFRIATNGVPIASVSFAYYANGATPQGGLVEGSDGGFYGTTSSGGAHYDGTVFNLTTNGALTDLYSFTGGNDGGAPHSGLVRGSDGNLYGTTLYGGTNSSGTVFRISTNGAFQSLYSFSGGHDGGTPYAGLAQASYGNLYGTTYYGGTNSSGTVFRISTNGVFQSLYSFTNGNDGGYPQAGLVQGSDGNLYGTTCYGGANGSGTVFRLTTNGALTTLCSFKEKGAGSLPIAGLVQGSDGALYGTTSEGGANGDGTIFSLTTNGILTTLYSFQGKGDGSEPLAGLVQGSDGALYGTTYYGGVNGQGTVFRLALSSLPAPDLVPLSVMAAAALTNSQPNPTTQVSWTVTNQGVGPAPGGWYDRVWFSPDGVFDARSVSLGDFYNSQTLLPGGSYSQTKTVTVPITNTGPFTLLVQANAYGQIYESDTNNNFAASAPAAFTLQPPDLVTVFVSTPASVTYSQPNPTVQVAWEVTNQGIGLAPGGWYDRVWFSTNGVLDSHSVDVGDFYNSQSLLSGGSYTETNTVTIPMSASGGYTLFVQANIYGNVYELNTSNNIAASAPASFLLQPPDLVPLSVTAPAVVDSSQPYPVIQVSCVVTNQGIGLAPGNWYERVWFSTNGVLDGQSVDIGDFYFGQNLPAGGSYPQAVSVTLPVTNNISYTLFVQLNIYAGTGYGYYYSIYESNYSNNISSGVPGTFSLTAPPDLAVLSASAPATVTAPRPNPSVQVTWAVTNQGLGLAPGGWYDRVWFSTNGVLDTRSQDIGDFYQSQNLPAGGSYSRTNNVTLPMTAGGSYTLFVQVDVYNYIYEPNKANNISPALPGNLILALADLAVLAVTPATNNVVFYPASPQSPTVQLAWAVTNQGVGPAVGNWYDRVYVSTNSTVAGAVSSQYFWQYWASSPFAAGAEYQVTNTISLPQQNGTYYLIVSVDDGDAIYEANKANNVLASAPLTVAYQVRPADLAVVSASAPATVSSTQPNPAVQVTWGVTNQGTGAASAVWYDRVWFSTNGLLDGQSVDVGDFYHSQNLAAGGSYQETNTVSLPVTNNLSYDLFVQVDVFNQVYETNKLNNISAALPEIFSLIPLWTVSATNNPPADGYISGTGSYLTGATNVLTAYPNFGYVFVNWTEGASVVGTNLSLTNVIFTNLMFAANYADATPIHVVTTATSPAGLAAVAGAGTYSDGQTANFSAPLLVTNPPNLYTFQEYTENNNPVSSTAAFAKTFSTFDPASAQFVAVYSASSILPVLVNVGQNPDSPVPATTNFILTVQFDRSMRTNPPPTIVLTNPAATLQPVVPGNGLWSATAFSNDTYSTPPVTFIAGMDGTNQIFVSAAQDLGGDVMAPTNAGGVIVQATPPPAPVLTVTASNSSSVTVAWAGYAAPSDLSFFRVYLQTSNFTSVAGLPILTSLGSGARAFQFGGLALDTQYYAAVQAVDSAGNVSGVSVLPVILPETIPPPVSVQAAPVGANSVLLSWNSYNTSALLGFAGFTLYYAPSNFSSVPGSLTGLPLGPLVQSYQVSGLDRTKTYYFAVVGFNLTNGFNQNVTTAVWSDPYAGNIGVNTAIGGAGQSQVSIYNNIVVVSNATLTIQPGTTLLFAPGTSLTVQQGSLVANGTALSPVILDSANDVPGLVPAAGDWAGVSLGSGASSSSLKFVEVLYGGGLTLSGCSPTVYAFTANNNTPCGLLLQNGAALTTSDALLTANAIGAQQSDTSVLTIQNSVIQNNGTNALASGGSPMNAASDWWGTAAAGTLAAQLQGNVSYTPFLTYEPVLTPAIGASNGVTQVGADSVSLQLACRTAQGMRLSEDYTFTGVFFAPFTNSTVFPLSAGGGLKRVYAQFRSVTGQTNAPLELDVDYITTGPVVQSFNLTQGETLNRPLTVTGSATAVLGMQDMEFYVDGVLVGTNAGGNLSQYFDIRSLSDAIHQVELIARDQSGNIATLENTVVIAITPPPAPVITNPAVDLIINTNLLTVSGSAEQNVSIQLTANGQIAGATVTDGTGAFTVTNATLVEGVNNVVAVAFDSTGTTPSAARHVIVETMPPAALVMSPPVYTPGSGLTLSWNNPLTGKLAVTFQLFWSQQPFTATNQATGNSIVLTTMSDTVQGLADGLYYFGVVGYDATGAASPLSALVSTVYDATPPALTVSYGHASPVTVGPLLISLTAGKTLAAAPSLTLQPYGSVSPVLLSLTNIAINTWQTVFAVTSTTPSGPVAMAVSAQDLSGNVYSGPPNGPVLVIDTVPPAAAITTSPPPPVQTSNNINVAVSLTLTKSAGPGTVPALAFTTPTGTNIPVPMNGSGSNWSGTLPLTPSAGAGFGRFSFSAQDTAGNTGSNLLAGGQLELYNTALPSPPAAPLGLTAATLPGGYVSLAWNTVSNAQIYRLYREPGTNWTTPAVLDIDGITSNGVVDLPPADGLYSFGVTASRLGSESGISNVVAGVSIRTPPLAPTNVAVSLAASGVQITWQEPAGGNTPDHYNVYRNGTLIQSVPNVTPVVDYPPLGTNSYVVASVDAVGNQNLSAPAVFYLPVAPVGNLTVLSVPGQAPVLTWNAAAGDVGFNVYRNGILQNSALITGTNYTDNLPLSDAERYAVTAVNSSSQESPPRLVTVYPVNLSLLVNSMGSGTNNPLLTGYFDQFQVGIFNLAGSNSLPLQQVQLLRTITGVEPLTVALLGSTNVNAGAQLQELITVPESPVVAAQSVRVTAFQQTDSAGSTVVYENTFNLTDSQLPGTEIVVSVNQLPLVGGDTTFQLQIFNRGYANMEVIVSRGFGSQPGDVYVSVQNSLGQEVGRTALSGLVSGASYLSDGTAYVTIAPGASKILNVTNVLVPAALGDAKNVTFLAVASEIFNEFGTGNQEVSGPLSGSMVSPSLAEPPYYGSAQTDKMLYANNQPVLISGQALNTASGLPAPNVPLNIGFATRGFAWFESVTTDNNGNYHLTYNPFPGLAGTLTIWAANPLVVDELDQAQVTIYRTYAIPSSADIQMSKNGQLSFSIQLLNPGNVPLTGFASSVQAWQVSGTNLVPISTVTGSNQIPPGFVLGAGQTATVNLELSAALSAPDTAQVQFTLTSIEGASATFTGTVDLFPAIPVLSVASPPVGYLEVSVNRGTQLSGQVSIKNTGLLALQGITLTPPTNSWMTLNLPVSGDGQFHLPDLAIGQSNSFGVVFTPPTNTVLGFYEDSVTVQGTNSASPFVVRVYAQVTSSVRGGIQFEVDNVLGELVPNASIMLHNNALLANLGPFYTDTNGLVTVTNLQIGDWNWQVTAAGFSGNVGTTTVLADQVVEQTTRLSENLVTINFSVVPVPFMDIYQISVTQTYQTYVPLGVLVLDPPFLSFSNLPSGFQATFNVNAQNQGLIQMTDVSLTGAESSGFSATPLITYIPVLLPMQSVSVPLVVAKDSPGVAGGQSAQARQAISDCLGAASIKEFANGINVIAQAIQRCPRDNAPEKSQAQELLEEIEEQLDVNGGIRCLIAYASDRNSSNLVTCLRDYVAEELVDHLRDEIIEFIGEEGVATIATAGAAVLMAEAAGALIGCAGSVASSGGGDGGGGGGGGPGPTASQGFVAGNGCFAAATPILMADGTVKAISDIRMGDAVRSGPKAGNIALVNAVYSLVANNLQEIRLASPDARNPESLLATEEHQFWVDGKGWVAARVVGAGDWLFDSAGRRIRVLANQSVTRRTTVYTFSLDRDNSFYANGVLVHDLCGEAPPEWRARLQEVAK